MKATMKSVLYLVFFQRFLSQNDFPRGNNVRFMLCNNEQFTSATTILNVFIVNMIWSEVPNRRALQESEHLCIQAKLT